MLFIFLAVIIIIIIICAYAWMEHSARSAT